MLCSSTPAKQQAAWRPQHTKHKEWGRGIRWGVRATEGGGNGGGGNCMRAFGLRLLGAADAAAVEADRLCQQCAPPALEPV